MSGSRRLLIYYVSTGNWFRYLNAGLGTGCSNQSQRMQLELYLLSRGVITFDHEIIAHIKNYIYF